MAKIKEQYEFNISGHFLCALVNADISGLTDDEIEKVEAFDTDYPLACFDISDNTHFTRCEIGGLMDMCHDVTVTIFK